MSGGAQIDPVLNESIQTQLELIRQQVEASVQTSQPTVATTTNTEIQTSLKALKEQLENQVNTQMSGGAQIDPVLNESIQTQLELIRQQVEASVQTSQPTVATTTNTEIQTSLKALKEQLENQVNTQMSGGAQIDPTLASSIQNQLELIRQQVEASVQTSQPTVATTTNTEIQTSLKALKEQLENQVNTQMSGGAQIDPTLASSIQNQLELIRQQIDDSLRVGGGATPMTNTDVQTQLKTLKDQIENQVNAQMSGGQIDPVLNESIQNQLELIRQQIDDSLRVGGDITPMTNTDVQTQLKTLKDQIENQVNAQMSTGAQIDPVLNESIQTQLELIRQQIDDSLRVGGGATPIPNAEVQFQLEFEKRKIESTINKFARHFAARKTRLHAGRLASSETTRLVEGKVEVDYAENTFKRSFKSRFNSRGESGAFGYAPRRLSASTSEWGRKMKLYMLNLKQKVTKNQWYTNAKDPWNNIDIGKNAGKAGMFALEFVDFFDEISDKISIASTFVDGFLYDPDGTELDWFPLSNKALDQVAQQSVKLQLDEFKIYNDSLGPDEIKSTYPLIAGPLDLLESDAISGRSSSDDPEYAQRRLEYEIDAIRLKILNDTSQPYHQKILDAEFNGSESELQAYLSEDPLNSILDYDGLLSPTDYDAVYVYAFTEVCSFHSGKTYIDTYTDADGNTNRKKPQCGWATKEACALNATTWIEGNSQGSSYPGSYGEWFTWTQLNTIFAKLQQVDSSFVPPLTTTSPLYSELNTNGICIVTGAGQHFSCKDAGGIYDPLNHRCVFTKEICQYYGTCYDATPTVQNCFIPKDLDQVQNFFGQSFPREWIRLNGCLTDGSGTDQFKQVLKQTGNFFTKSGGRFLDDISKNKKNWSAGMKQSFTDPNNIANLGMIFGPSLLGLGTASSMIIIAFVVGGMMADTALKANREAAQKPPTVPAEYTVGGWRSNYTDVPLKDRCKVTGITETVVSTQQGPLGFAISSVYLVFTTDTSHGFAVGDKLYHQGLSQKIGINFYDASGQNSEFTISEIPTPTTIKINQVYSVSAQPLSIDPTDVYVYAKTLPATKVYNVSNERTDPKSLVGVPATKMATSVGFVDGWLTKPLRPRKSDGTTLVKVTEGVDQIAGAVDQDFFIDVRPIKDSTQQVPLAGGCSPNQYGLSVIDSPCVNTAVNKNYSIAAGYDGNSVDAAHLYKCLADGMKSFWAFSAECKKATAVDAATGFVESAYSGTSVSVGFEWAPLQKYKRLCSERDTYGLGDPMIRAWDAPHINKTWCIPELPPLSWVNSDIGQLNPVETPYARNRAWTGGVDPNSPEVHMTVVEEGGNYEVGDSAKYWYYQLVYDPELFNRNALWNDTLLNDNFSISTISEMRRYYCLQDFKTFYEAETLDQLDDRCWGYTSISTTNYSFTPMTNIGNIIT